MEIQISYEQMKLLLETIGKQLDLECDQKLFSLYLRLLVQAKEEGIDIASLEIHV